LTQAEIDTQIEQAADRVTEIGEPEKALAMLVADIWQVLNTGNVPNQNPAMTQAEARQAIKDRLKAHIRTLRGM